jgi:ankyrin repeat protein
MDVIAKSGASYVPKETILPKAAMNNDVENVCHLLNAGVDVNEVQNTREDNTAALHEAAGANHLEMAKLLLEHGADVNAKTVAGYESFVYLANVRCGMSHIWSSERTTRDFTTPLHWAVMDNHIEMVKLLLLHGADINLFDHHEFKVAER